MTLTAQQSSIIQSVLNRQSIQGAAGPGCGKTFLLTQLMRACPSASGVALAFNASIAEELRTRIEPASKWQGLTTHVWGKRSLKKRPVDAYGSKLKRLFDDRYNEGPLKKDRRTILSITKLLREQAYGIPGGIENKAVMSLLQNSSIELTCNLESALRAAVQLVRDADADRSQMDFQDMLRMPLIDNAPFPCYDFILIDELQDWSLLQRLLLTHALKWSPQATILGVGDPHQAIFAFRGADANSFEACKQAFNLTTLPLNKTWRCPQSICQEANKLYPDALDPQSKTIGSVTTTTYEDFLAQSLNFTTEDFILCRVNAPLLGVARHLIQARRQFKLKASVIQQLEYTITRMRATSLSDLRLKLNEAKLKETGLAKTSLLKAAIADKYEALLSCTEGARTITDVIDLLRTLTEGTTGPTLSSIHSIKGLEADRVWLLRPDLCPHPAASTPEELEQETNLKFVAVTRAKQSLIYVQADR